MKRILLPLAACAACLCLGSARAQEGDVHDDAPIYEGAWNVRFGDQRAARFELQDWNGMWRETGSMKAVARACRGHKLPVTVQQSNAHELESTVWGSAVSKDCPDASFTFKPRDGRTLEADTADGVHVTMTRVLRR